MNIDLSYFTSDIITKAEKKLSGTKISKIKNPKKIIKANGKAITKKSKTRFVMDEYIVKVFHENKIYKILNNVPIENQCLVFPTPLNDRATKPQYFEFVSERFKDRVELISTFWSRYDFKKEPVIKSIDGDGVWLED